MLRTLIIFALTLSYAQGATPEVVVYSGVPCGIAASIMAAREGANVVLVEPTRHVGGLSTSGINTAESEHMLKWTIGGFADEFYHVWENTIRRPNPSRLIRIEISDSTPFILRVQRRGEGVSRHAERGGVEVRYGASVDR